MTDLVLLPSEGRESREEDVGEDPDGPHVRGQAHGVVLDDLGGNELRGPLAHPGVGGGAEAPGEPKVNYLYQETLYRAKKEEKPSNHN